MEPGSLHNSKVHIFIFAYIFFYKCNPFWERYKFSFVVSRKRYVSFLLVGFLFFVVGTIREKSLDVRRG